MPKTIWELELHGSIELSSADHSAIMCMRVPGGWIYTMAVEGMDTEDGVISQVFVPYNIDLKPKPKEKPETILDLPESEA